MMGRTASHAYQWNISQLVLHHPFKVSIQIAVNQEYVKGSLVIGHKDIGLAFLQILLTLDLYRQQQHFDNKPRPALSGVITPKVSVAKQAADDRHQRSYNRSQQDNWQANQQLIDAIDNSHDKLFTMKSEHYYFGNSTYSYRYYPTQSCRYIEETSFLFKQTIILLVSQHGGSQPKQLYLPRMGVTAQG